MAHIHLKKWQLSRRHLLRGMGASIALPFLDAMASTCSVPPPRRSVFLYIPNGVNTLTWQIENAGADYELTAPLLALEKYREEITPISGLHHPGALGRHHHCDKVWLTGAEVPGDGGPFRNGVSADQIIAEAQGHLTPLSSLPLAIEGSSLSWGRSGTRIPALRDPLQIFRKLFGIQRSDIPPRGSLLDALREQIMSVRARLGGHDLDRLEQHLSLIRSVELRVNQPGGVGLESKHRLFDELMVLALCTDATRVITCMIGSESHSSPIPEIGIRKTRHELSHHHDEPEAMHQLTQADTFLILQFSHLLHLLKQHRENGIPLLDTTQILWGSGMSCGHSHGTANLPLILAGGRQLGHRHGSHVDFNLPKIGRYNLSDPQEFRHLCSKPIDTDAHLGTLLREMIHRATGGARAVQNPLEDSDACYSSFT